MGDKQPLNLPKGSVRSIIALFVVISCISAIIGMYLTVLIANMNGKEVEVPTAVVATLSALASSVITYYFTMRNKPEPVDLPVLSDCPDDTPDMDDIEPVENTLNED